MLRKKNQMKNAAWDSPKALVNTRMYVATPLIIAGGVKLIFTGGHVSLAVASKGPNIILGLCTCNYSLTKGKKLGGARVETKCRLDKTRWRARCGPRALCLPPVQ